MELLTIFAIGGFFAAGAYLMLRHSIVKLILGTMLLTHGGNLLLLLAGGLVQGQPPLGEAGMTGATDPLPQALILTAIVINFGILAFFLVLVYRAYQTNDAKDLDELHGGDR